MLLLLGLGILHAQDSTEVKGARLSASENVFDFGEVPSDTAVSHIFVLKNIGSDSLRIYRLKSGWGCTAALLSSEVIAPDSTAQIKATFNTHGRMGVFQKSIKVYSNDTTKPVVTLFIKGKIVPQNKE